MDIDDQIDRSIYKLAHRREARPAWLRRERLRLLRLLYRRFCMEHAGVGR